MICFLIFSANNNGMKKFLVILILILFILSTANSAVTLSSVNDDTIIIKALQIHPKLEKKTRVMTYNLLADSAGFEGSSAFTRAKEVCTLINEAAPDVAGLQEVSRNWLFCISKNTEYKIINSVKTAIFGTMTVLAYNPDTLSLLHSGEQVFSEGTHTRLRRFVWGVFERKKDGKCFCVINTHLSLSKTDGVSAVNQAYELAKFINDLYYEYKLPVFITGDFNSGERKEHNNQLPSVYEILCTVAKDTKSISSTLNYGNGKSVYASNIDHIFIRGDAQLEQYTVLSQSEFLKLSDHYPVFIDLTL